LWMAKWDWGWYFGSPYQFTSHQLLHIH
jgi:hypothetical protein